MAALHHLALRTPDVARLASFYRAAFGLAVARESERSVWLRVGETTRMLERAEASEPGVPSGSLELVAFHWGGTLEAARAHLQALGITPEAETSFTLYFRDPDGRRVALSNYAFESAR